MSMPQDEPRPLEDTSWIAVKGGMIDVIVKVLNLSEPKAASWMHGMEVVGGYHGDCPTEWAELAGVFITPPSPTQAGGTMREGRQP
jgi:hypothetical protein